MALVDQLLKGMVENGASDLHLIVGQPAKVRISGDLTPLTNEPIAAKQMEKLLQEICTKQRWEDFIEKRDLDFAYEIEGLARFRTNYLYNYNGMAAVFREIPSKILTLEDLNLPDILRDICDYKSGLVCVTGPTGSGKSTTLAAMIDYINKNKSKHIITLEDPIEFVHNSANSIIVHREIGMHTKSFADALMGAMRSDPDIILLGEMRDMETIKLALTCAAMGMLVFATLHTNNAPKTIDRIIDAFPSDEQPQVRTMLAESLKAVVSQLLCKKKDGGRIAVHEVLLWTDGLPNIIRNGQISNIKTIIESNKNMGMCSMDGNLKNLLLKNVITGKEAYMKATDKKVFIKYLEDESE